MGPVCKLCGPLTVACVCKLGLIVSWKQISMEPYRQTHPTKPSSAIQNREKILRSILRHVQTFSISAPGDVIRRLNLNNVEVIIMMMSNVP